MDKTWYDVFGNHVTAQEILDILCEYNPLGIEATLDNWLRDQYMELYPGQDTPTMHEFMGWAYEIYNEALDAVCV